MSKAFNPFQLRRCATLFAQSLACRKGFIGIATALVLVPTASLVGGGFLYQRAVTNSSVYTLATTQAALAAAKTTMKLQPVPDHFLTDAWIRENSRSVANSSTIVATGISRPTTLTYRANVTYDAKPDYTGGIAKLFTRNNAAQNFADVEIFYRPLELTITLDGSMSQAYDIPGTQTMVSEALNEVFFGNESAEDVRVSLFSYSDVINLGVEYARKITNADSRKLQGPGTRWWRAQWDEATKPANIYEAQVKMLKNINPALPDDLLADGGPGVGIDYAPVGRLPLKDSNTDIVRYVDLLENPPTSEEDKPPFLVADSRITVNEDWTISTQYWSGPSYTTKQFDNLNAKEMFLLPDSWYDKKRFPTHAQEAVNGGFKNWNGYPDYAMTKEKIADNEGDTSLTYDKVMVNIYATAPTMPLLAGSQSRQEVMERMSMYNGVYSTGVDEAFTWSYRLSSPSWSWVWDRGSDFPAPYRSGVDKHFVMFLGGPTVGYTGATVSSGTPDITPEVCKRIAQKGIKVHILVPSDDVDSSEVKMFEDCVAWGKTIGSEFLETDDVHSAFVRIVSRAGKIRLKSPL